MSHGFMKSLSYFSQILKADLEINFPKGSTLLKYVEDLLLHSFSKVSSKDDSIYLLEFLAFQGHKVSKEILQFV